MKIAAIFLIVLCFFSQLFGQTYQWTKTIGGAGSDHCQASMTDDYGNIYSAGSFFQTVDFDPGVGVVEYTAQFGTDMFIQKLNPQGELDWVKIIDGKGNTFPSGLDIDSWGNIVITGTFDDTVDFDPGLGEEVRIASGPQDAFVMKLDPFGNLLWLNMITGENDIRGVDVCVNFVGEVFISGIFFETVHIESPTEGTTFSSNGYFDTYVSKMDPEGNVLWASHLGNDSIITPSAVESDGVGNFYLTGSFNSEAVYNADSLNLSVQDRDDAFILKIKPNGELDWVKSLSGSGFESYNEIFIDEIGNIYGIGSFNETIDLNPGSAEEIRQSVAFQDIFLQKLNSNGEYIWGKSFGGTKSDDGLAIFVSGESIFTGGRFQEQVDFDTGPGIANLVSNGWIDAYIQKLDTAGNHIWAFSYGGVGEENLYEIFPDSEDNVYATGIFSETVDFNQGGASDIFTSAGSRDVYLIKLGQELASVEENSLEIDVFPNPTSNSINVNVDAEIVSIEVISTRGERVLSSNSSVIDVSSIEKGVYFLHCETNKEIVVRKFVKH